MTSLDRRRLLRAGATLTAAGLLGPMSALAGNVAEASPGPGRGRRGTALLARDNGGYGPLVEARGGDLLLPRDFTYVRFGEAGSMMSDGVATPASHDGMGAFPGPDGLVRLIRNHEQDPGQPTNDRHYDRSGAGGTTTVDFDPEAGEQVRSFASLSGTIRNCAGGRTPWGSWLSCEETTAGAGPSEVDGFPLAEPHGYVFEVPADAEEAVAPVPLVAMGRFQHEAVAVDAASGVVYETEDRDPSGFYRFVPDVPGQLVEGGRLEMLRVRGRAGYDARRRQRIGLRLPVDWVPIDDPDPAARDTDVGDRIYRQGLEQGGATFARGEGAWAGDGVTFFVCTSGGDAGTGQLWEYTPRDLDGGFLRLVFESPGRDVLDSPDNCTVSPAGSVLLCEDPETDAFIRGVTPRGELFSLLMNNRSDSELAGATFSPDGRWLFFNMQADGITFGVTGPWERGAV